MQPEQGLHTLHGAIGQHPGRPLGRFLRRLEQQPHPRAQLCGQGREQPRHTEPHGGVQVVPTGMHQPLLAGGEGQAGPFLHGQGIHVDPHGNQRRPHRSQLAHHTGAADPFAHLPTEQAQFTGHQGRRLVFGAAQLGVGMDMPAQTDQLGRGLLQSPGQIQPLPQISRGAAGTADDRTLAQRQHCGGGRQCEPDDDWLNRRRPALHRRRD